jgi:hypothetical protein
MDRRQTLRGKYVYNSGKASVQIGTNIRGHDFNVDLLPEFPATGQLDQGSPLFSSVLEQSLGWYPNFMSHRMLPIVISTFCPNAALQMFDNI